MLVVLWCPAVISCHRHIWWLVAAKRGVQLFASICNFSTLEKRFSFMPEIHFICLRMTVQLPLGTDGLLTNGIDGCIAIIVDAADFDDGCSVKRWFICLSRTVSIIDNVWKNTFSIGSKNALCSSIVAQNLVRCTSTIILPWLLAMLPSLFLQF